MLLKVKELTPKANHSPLKGKKDNFRACQELPEGRAEENCYDSWSCNGASTHRCSVPQFASHRGQAVWLFKSVSNLCLLLILLLSEIAGSSSTHLMHFLGFSVLKQEVGLETQAKIPSWGGDPDCVIKGLSDKHRTRRGEMQKLVLSYAH